MDKEEKVSFCFALISLGSGGSAVGLPVWASSYRGGGGGGGFSWLGCIGQLFMAGDAVEVSALCWCGLRCRGQWFMAGDAVEVSSLCWCGLCCRGQWFMEGYLSRTNCSWQVMLCRTSCSWQVMGQHILQI